MSTVTPLAIPEVLLIAPARHGDARGFFSELYNPETLRKAGFDRPFIQDNQAVSARAGTLRGLHFQAPPFAQDKLVRCGRGALFDVAVDIRKGSPTFGRWVGAELSADNGRQLLVPAGFAHGYLTLTDDCEALYKVGAPYAPQCEGGLLWNDPAVGIDWPLDGLEVIINTRDAALPTLEKLDSPF